MAKNKKNKDIESDLENQSVNLVEEGIEIEAAVFLQEEQAERGPGHQHG